MAFILNCSISAFIAQRRLIKQAETICTEFQQLQFGSPIAIYSAIRASLKSIQHRFRSTDISVLNWMKHSFAEYSRARHTDFAK
jgi:preprotein translocase subunit YajC